MSEPIVSTRRCADCEQDKPLSEFSLRNRDKGYFASYCKPCNSERTKAYNRVHVDQVRGNNRNFRARNPEKIKEYNQRGGRRWRAKNPTYYKERHAANRIARNQRSREWYCQNQDKAKARMIRQRLLNRERAAEKMLARINDLLPEYLPSDVKEEAAQSLMLSLLTGETTPASMQSAVKRFIKEAWPTDINLRSLDAPITEDGDPLVVFLSDRTCFSSPLPRKESRRDVHPKSPGRPPKHVDWNRVSELRGTGLSWSQVGAKLGVHRNTLGRIKAMREAQVEKTA